jgi:hypothetical protein
MLILKPSCECCDTDISPETGEAYICSFECTFCVSCANTVLNGICPNCGGELVPRPRRPVEVQKMYPASTERVFNPECMKSSKNT